MRLLAELTAQFQELSSADLTEVGPDASFMEMGLDSLFLVQACMAVEKGFGIRITFHQLMQEMTTLNQLASYVDRKLPTETLAAPAAHLPAMPSEGSASALANAPRDAMQDRFHALENDSNSGPFTASALEYIPRAPRARQSPTPASLIHPQSEPSRDRLSVNGVIPAGIQIEEDGE
jgi:acyl carrier protein